MLELHEMISAQTFAWPFAFILLSDLGKNGEVLEHMKNGQF